MLVLTHCGTSEADIEALQDWVLATIGIKVSSKKRQSKKQDSVSIGRRKESFIGEEWNKLLLSHEQLLDYMTGKYKLNNAYVAMAKMAWRSYQHVWDLMLTPIQTLATKDVPHLSDRKRRSSLVKALAEAFVKAFTNAACHSDHATVYIHVLQCHVPGFIKGYGSTGTYSTIIVMG
jgi:hypothetical protein